MNRAFSLVEILISLGILIAISGVSVYGFVNLKARKDLDSAKENIVETLNRARNLTVSALDNQIYGVKLDTDRVTLFRGSVYSSSDSSNEVTLLPDTTLISVFNLNPTTTEIKFEKFTGETNVAGTIGIVSTVRNLATSTITIYSSGVVE